MNNPLDYLWYKTYKSKLYNRGQSMGFVLLANLCTICLLIFGMDSLSFGSSLLLIILSFVLTCPYERSKKKQIKVIRKYYKESDESRIRGNIIVAIYVIISFVTFFLVAKYHITIQNIL
jgi:uncharacterized membrane protein